jgi:hypothetical protein
MKIREGFERISQRHESQVAMFGGVLPEGVHRWAIIGARQGLRCGNLREQHV